MKNTKKVLSVALAGALAFGSMGAAFAATPVMGENVDKKITEAVERLSSFGIVNGMEDGKYHEEMKVTREQFAKIIVEALGLGSAADAAKGATKFSDVEASRWSAGYINVAQGQGLLSGYPDGTFKPAAEVSYAEAVTMLVRALGYKDEFLAGSWPGNYVAKAADTGITSGAKFSDAAGKADRGTVAVLVDNALDSKVVKVSEYVNGDIKYAESKKTLLKEKLDVSKYENVRIVANKLVDDSLNKNEVTVNFLKDMDKDDEENVKNVYTTNDSGKEFDLGKDINVEDVIGEEATVYLNDDNEIIYAESENDDKVNVDYISGVDTSKDKVSLVKFDDDYAFDDDAIVNIFNGSDKYTTKKGSDMDDAELNKLPGKVGKFVVKNKKIVYAEIMDVNETIIVTENKDGKLKAINGTDEKYVLDLSKDGNYDGVMAFDQNGKKLEVKDIEKGNVVYLQNQTYDGDDYAVLKVITNNEIKGKLGRVKSDRIEIAGKETKVVKYTDKDAKDQYSTYYSVDKNENSEQWDPTSEDWDQDMKDADDAEVVAYLDAVGRIAYVTTEAEATSGYIYGVVTQTYADNDRVKVYSVTADGKGKELTYTAEESDNLDRPIKLDAYGNTTKTLWGSTGSKELVNEGSVVKFKLNKDGEISEDEFYMMDKANYYKMASGKDFGKNTIPASLKGTGSRTSFEVTDKVKMVDAKDLTKDENDNSMDAVKVSDDFGIVKWSELKEDNYDSSLEFYVFADDDQVDVKAVVFVGKGASTSSDAEAVYVIDTWTKGGDDYVKYVNEDKKEVEKEVADNMIVKDEKAYIVKINSDGKIDLTPDNNGDYEEISGQVTKRDGDIVTVDGKNYKLSSNTVVYEEDKKKSISNISKDDAVTLIVENGVSVRVAERHVGSEATKIKNAEDQNQQAEQTKVNAFKAATVDTAAITGNNLGLDLTVFAALNTADKDAVALIVNAGKADLDTKEKIQAKLDSAIAKVKGDAEQSLANAVKAINDASTKANMATAITTNAVALGLDLTDYNGLTDNDPVEQALIDAADFANKTAVKTAFDNAVTAQKAVEVDKVALAAINDATNAVEMETAIKAQATVLGLDLADYNGLADNNPVDTALKNAADATDFTNKVAVKTAFDNAVAAQKSVEADEAVVTAFKVVGITPSQMDAIITANKAGVDSIYMGKYNALEAGAKATALTNIIKADRSGIADLAGVKAAIETELKK